MRKRPERGSQDPQTQAAQTPADGVESDSLRRLAHEASRPLRKITHDCPHQQTGLKPIDRLG